VLTLIFLLIFGSGVAYLALQNTTHVTFTVFSYTFSDVPLFSVIIGSVLVGALMVYIIHLINSISTAFTIHGKNKKIKESEKNVTELTKKIHQLELENEALKKGGPSAVTDDKAL
jgi:lipopolysaccharide assembly protein A